MSLSICADRKDVEGNYAISMATSYFERGRATRDKKKGRKKIRVDSCGTP